MSSYYDRPILNIRSSYHLPPPSNSFAARDRLDHFVPPLHPPPSYDRRAPPSLSPRRTLSPLRSLSPIAHFTVPYADHPAYSPPWPWLTRLWRSLRRRPERLDPNWSMPEFGRPSHSTVFDSRAGMHGLSVYPLISDDPACQDLAMKYEERISLLNEEIPKALISTRLVLSCLEISAYIWIALLVVSLAAGNGQQTVGFTVPCIDTS
jgi:hypothetical protein